MRPLHHFVYSLTIEGQAQPFYIGKGTYKTRPYAHLTKARRGEKSLKSSVIRKAERLGLKILVETLFSTTDEAVAFATESELIRKFGRRGIDPNGILTNCTIGGEGRCGNKTSEEQKHRQSLALLGRVRTVAHCVALSMARRGHDVSPQTREKIAEALRGKPLREPHKLRVQKALLGHSVSPETRAKISAKHKGRSISIPQRLAIAATLKGRKRTESSVDKSARYTREEACRHVQAQIESKLSQAEYCRQWNIKPQTFCGWKRSPYVRAQAS